MQTNQRKLLIIGIVGTMIVLFTSIVLLGRESSVEKNPLVADFYPREVNNSGGPVVIKTKDILSDKEGSVEINPKVDGEVQVVDEYIIFWPGPEGMFKENDTYTAKISGYKTANNKSIDTINLTFSIDNTIPYAPLQTEVQLRYGRPRGLFVDQILEKIIRREPFLYNISVKALGTPGVSRHVISIESLVIQGREESAEIYEQNVKASQQAAVDWIRSQGVDPDTDIEIVYPSNDQSLIEDNFTGDGEFPVEPVEP